MLCLFPGSFLSGGRSSERGFILGGRKVIWEGVLSLGAGGLSWGGVIRGEGKEGEGNRVSQRGYGRHLYFTGGEPFFVMDP